MTSVVGFCKGHKNRIQCHGDMNRWTWSTFFRKSQASFCGTTTATKGNHGKNTAVVAVTQCYWPWSWPKTIFTWVPFSKSSATKKHLWSARMVREFGRKHVVIAAQPLWLQSCVCISYLYIYIYIWLCILLDVFSTCNCHLCPCRSATSLQPACDEMRRNQSKTEILFHSDKSHGRMSYICHRFGVSQISRHGFMLHTLMSNCQDLLGPKRNTVHHLIPLTLIWWGFCCEWPEKMHVHRWSQTTSI